MGRRAVGEVEAGAAGPTFASSKFAGLEPSPTWVNRARLLERLDTAVGAAFTLVTGSPGSGKTSLLSQWARRQPEGSVAWLNCDHADLDPARFCHALISAIATVRPGFGAECLDLLTLKNSVDQDLLEALLTAFELLDPPLSVVLDDFQFVGNQVKEDLRFLISRGTGGLRVLMSTRVDPMLGLERLRLTGGLCEVREADLRFSARDAGSFLKNLGVEVDRQELDLLMSHTEGWAAGVQLAGLALRDVDRREDLVARLEHSHGLISHYLWSEVFEAQSAEMKRFLLDTCVVNELSPELAAALSPGTPVSLLDIEAANLLLQRLDPAGRSFRYHQLFADMLRARLRASAPDHERLLHERAATWYLTDGNTPSAFRHRWRAGQRAAAIATMHGTVLDSYYDDLLPSFDEGDYWLTDDDLMAVPGPAISYCAFLLIRGFVEEAERLSSRIETVAGATLDRRHLRQLRTMRVIDSLVLADTRATLQHGAALMAIADPPGAPDDDWYVLGISVLARVHAWRADPRAAMAILDNLHFHPTSRTVQLELAATRAFSHVVAGELSQAIRIATELMDQLATSEASSADVNLQPMGILGSALLERGRLAEAEAMLRQVSDTVSKLRFPIRISAKIAMSRIWRAEGKVDAAAAIVDEAYQLLGRRPMGSAMLDQLRAAEAHLLLDRDDVASARPIIDDIGIDVLRSLLLARAAISSRKFDEAHERIEGLARSAQSIRQRLDAELLRLSIAIVCREHVDEVANAVLDLASPNQNLFPLIEAGSTTLDAVRRVARRRPRTAYTDDLMRARPRVPATSTAHTRCSKEALSDRERTVLQYLATAMTYSEIAEVLYVSINTVKTHVRNITRKLQASSRDEAVVRARELHYL